MNYSKGTINVSEHYKSHVAVLNRNAKKARRNLYKLERELSKIKNHAPSAKLELIARLMIIFKPETRKEIEAIVTLA